MDWLVGWWRRWAGRNLNRPAECQSNPSSAEWTNPGGGDGQALKKYVPDLKRDIITTHISSNNNDETIYKMDNVSHELVFGCIAYFAFTAGRFVSQQPIKSTCTFIFNEWYKWFATFFLLIVRTQLHHVLSYLCWGNPKRCWQKSISVQSTLILRCNTTRAKCSEKVKALKAVYWRYRLITFLLWLGTI